MAMNATNIAVLQKCAYVVGVGFLGACVIHAGTGGWAIADGELGKGALYAFIMACVTVAAALLPTLISKVSETATVPTRLFMSVALVACIAGELVGNMAALGHNRNKSITTANDIDQKVSDRRNSIADTERSIAALESALGDRSKSAGWLSTKPSAAWEADVKNFEGDKLYARSKQCSSVTLADSRAFCDRVAEARANLAVAKAHEADAASLAKLKGTLAGLRDAARSDQPASSATRTQSDNFVRLAGFVRGEWVQVASEEGRSRANFGVELFMVAVMTLVPMALIYVGTYDWTASPSNRIGKARRLMAWFRGDKVPATEAPASTVMTRQDTPERTTHEAPTFALHKATVGEANRARVEALLARLPGRIEARAA